MKLNTSDCNKCSSISVEDTMGKPQNNMKHLQVRRIKCAKSEIHTQIAKYDMVSLARTDQYEELDEEGRVIVIGYTKVPQHLCYELLDWCARHQDVKPNLFKGIQSQREIIQSSKYAFSLKTLRKIEEACQKEELEIPTCLVELFKLIPEK